MHIAVDIRVFNFFSACVQLEKVKKKVCFTSKFTSNHNIISLIDIIESVPLHSYAHFVWVHSTIFLSPEKIKKYNFFNIKQTVPSWNRKRNRNILWLVAKIPLSSMPMNILLINSQKRENFFRRVYSFPFIFSHAKTSGRQKQARSKRNSACQKI
jgi:hypothetical protein